MQNHVGVDGELDSPNLPFPARTKQAAGTINGTLTDAMVVEFSDRIMVILSQRGRVVHWLRVSLDNSNPATDGLHNIPAFGDGNGEEDDDSLLPLSSLTASTLLGGHAPGQEIYNQLLARQIASAIVTKTPSEKRTLLVGLGLDRPSSSSASSTSVEDRETFFALVDLVLNCI